MITKYFTTTCVFIALICCFVLTANAQQNLSLDDKWQNKTFTRTTYEEDIKDTLRAIARLIDMQMTFGDGITDTVTMEFKDMPLKEAFDFLIDQYELEYSVDIHAIYIYKPGAEGLKDILLTLENINIDEIRGAIDRFGFMKKDIKIIHDPKMNLIFISGPPKDVDSIQRLINTMESAKKGRVEVRPEIRYFQLKYAKVVDTELKIGDASVSVPGLESVLTEILDLTQAGEVTEERTQGFESDIQGQTARQGGKIDPYSGRVKVLRKIISAEAGTITSDPRTNRIIIRDYPEKLDEYGKIIKEFDKPMKMVKIDVTIVEASKDFGREIGVGFAGPESSSTNSSFTAGTAGQARDIYDDNLAGTTDLLNLIPLLETAGGVPISSYGLAGTFLYQGSDYSLYSFLQLSETKGKSKTINKSSIITMDNMEAIVESTTEVTYKLQSGGDTPTVEEGSVSAGITLNVTPHIIEEEDGKKMVEMVVVAERSTFLSSRTDDIPEIASTNLTTQAVIGDESTLVVGGLFDNRYTMGETGAPCLMDIPGAGNLFKTTGVSNPKSNILFFLTPKVISLDKIPYEGSELMKKIENSEKELHKIDEGKRDTWIEKNQE